MPNRQPWLLLCALIALCGSLTAVFATTALRDFNLRGYVDPTQTVDLPFRIPRLGVNVELTQYPPDELSTQFELMQQANIHWLRQPVRWDEIETQPGQYDWSQWDSIISALEPFPDLKIVAVLVDSPPWTRDPALTATAPPQDPATFAAFAAVFAQRYAETIDHYQIWDEPNLTAAWGYLDPRPIEYVALLQAAYPAIHSADPGATVIAAALAPTTEAGPRNISDWRYLSDLYALGAADFMDAVAGKPYGFNSSPEERTVATDTLNFSRFIGLREVMLQYGDGKTPLWASNWGWNSLPDDWTGSPSIWGSIASEAQTEFTLSALDRADREWAWLGGMILYHWQPDAPPDDPVWGFAIRNSAGEATPLYEALVNRPQPVTATDGLYPAANPYTRYSGIWTFSELGADIGWLRDSRFAFDFSGTAVSLLLRKDNYVGYLYPRIDDQTGLANAVPQDNAGNPYIILTSGSLLPETSSVLIASDLNPGQHTLTAVADRGYDRYALAGYVVSSGNLAAPYNTQITLGWLAAAISLAGVIITGWQINWREFLRPLAGIWHRLSIAGQFALSLLASIFLMIGMLLTWGEATPTLFRREPVQLGLSILTAGLIYLNPALPLTIIAAIVLFIILYHRPAFGLALLIFFAPFFLFPVKLYLFAFPMSELLTIITFAAWLLRMAVQWAQPGFKLQFHWQSLDLILLAWVLLGMISLLWTQNRAPAVTELRTLFIEPALFYLIFRTLPLARQDILRIVDALLCAGFIVCIVGLYLYVRGEAVITAEDTARRLASVYGSPNNVALFLGRCLPFTLAFTLIPVDRNRRILASICFSLMLLTIILTQSVGALFIGVPAAVAAILLIVYRRCALIPLLILIALAVVGFIIGASVSERFARALDFTEGTNFYRLRVWESALNMLRDHPITGLGLDQFLYNFRGQYILPDAWQEPDLSHPHNFLLDIWIRLGLIGVLLFAIIQRFFWSQNLQNLRFLANDPLLLALTAGIIGSMVNLLTHGLIDNSLFVIDLAFIFTLLLALTSALSSANIRSIDVNGDKMV